MILKTFQNNPTLGWFPIAAFSPTMKINYKWQFSSHVWWHKTQIPSKPHRLKNRSEPAPAVQRARALGSQPAPFAARFWSAPCQGHSSQWWVRTVPLEVLGERWVHWSKKSAMIKHHHELRNHCATRGKSSQKNKEKPRAGLLAGSSQLVSGYCTHCIPLLTGIVHLRGLTNQGYQPLRALGLALLSIWVALIFGWWVQQILEDLPRFFEIVFLVVPGTVW